MYIPLINVIPSHPHSIHVVFPSSNTHIQYIYLYRSKHWIFVPLQIFLDKRLVRIFLNMAFFLCILFREVDFHRSQTKEYFLKLTIALNNRAPSCIVNSIWGNPLLPTHPTSSRSVCTTRIDLKVMTGVKSIHWNNREMSSFVVL